MGECNTCGKTGHKGAECKSGLPHNQHWNKKRASAGKGAMALDQEGREQDAGSLELLGMGMTEGDEYDAGSLEVEEYDEYDELLSNPAEQELNPLDHELPIDIIQTQDPWQGHVKTGLFDDGDDDEMLESMRETMDSQQ